MLMRAATVVQQLCKSCKTCFMFYCKFYFTCDRSFSSHPVTGCNGRCVAGGGRVARLAEVEPHERFSSFIIKLDGQGRARREAARRRKSEWKVNVALPNSSRSSGSWQVTPKTISLSIVEPRGIWTCVSLQCTSTSGGSTL